MERLWPVKRLFAGRPAASHGRAILNTATRKKAPNMNQVIYLVGLIVVVMAILSFVGIHV